MQIGAAKLLGEPPQFDDSHITEIGKIAIGAGDVDVKRALFRALVLNGSDEARRRVMRFALKTGNPPHHRLAADALWQNSTKVDEVLAAEITDAQLTARVASVAYPLTLIVGACAEATRVVASARVLAANPDRRALLVPLLIAAANREEVAIDQIEKLLPQQLVADLALALEDGGKKLRKDCLDGLGDVRTIEAVRMGLSFLFE